MRIGAAGLEDSHRADRTVVVVAKRIYGDIAFCPVNQLINRRSGITGEAVNKHLTQVVTPVADQFIGDAGGQDTFDENLHRIVACFVTYELALQRRRFRVAQIFVRQCFDKLFQIKSIHLFAVVLQEFDDFRMVALAAVDHVVKLIRSEVFVLVFCRLRLGGEGLSVGFAHFVLLGHPLLASQLRGGTHIVVQRLAHRRNDIESLNQIACGRHPWVRAFVAQNQHQMVLLAQVELSVGIVVALFCPNQQVAESGVEFCTAVFIGFHLCKGVIFCIIVEFEAHGGVFGGQMALVIDGDISRGGVGVVGEQVDAGVVRRALVDLFGTFVAAEDVGVHHHRACGGIGEPAHIEFGIGLAGPEEPPFAIHPNLHPGVVVVAVRPTRGVALAGGNAHGTEGRHREGALLTATPVRGLQRGQRRRCSRISRLIINIFVAPMVHLQGGIIHTHVLDAVLQLVEDVRPRGIQILIVHAIDDHEMTEDVVGDALPPRKGVPRFHGHLHLLLEKAEIVVGEVALRHVGVEEHEVTVDVAALFRRLQVVHADLVAHLLGDVLTVEIVLLNRRPIVFLGEKRRRENAAKEQDDGC